jgi:hypothetical protein
LTRGNQISKEGCGGKGTILIGRRALTCSYVMGSIYCNLATPRIVIKVHCWGCKKQMWRKSSMNRREVPVVRVVEFRDAPKNSLDFCVVKYESAVHCLSPLQSAVSFVFRVSNFRTSNAELLSKTLRRSRGMQPSGVTAVHSILVCWFCNSVILTNACLCVTYNGTGVHQSRATTPWSLNVIRWRLISVGPQ